jgi:hypothetical protein
LPITAQDIEMFPDIINSPDRVVANIKNKRGQDVIGFVKALPDGSTIVVTEVRTGRRELALTSARKYPPRANAAAIDAFLTLNARNDGGVAPIVIQAEEQFKQSVRGSYTPATNTIRLFKAVNMSTFVHESGHQWLFQMADDLGDARLLPEARAQIVEDLGSLKYLGVKGVDPTTATPE